VALELLIFDCDGVLFDSHDANVGFFNEILGRVGEGPLDAGARDDCHTLASVQLFERHYGDRPELLERIRDAAAATDYGPFFHLMRPCPLMRETLKQLREEHTTALATNRGRTLAGVLEFFSLGDLFDLVVGVDHVERPKPHPDVLLHCMESLRVPAPRSLYVGDQEGDALAAEAAGVRFVAVGGAVKEAGLRIATLAELPGVIAGL